MGYGSECYTLLAINPFKPKEMKRIALLLSLFLLSSSLFAQYEEAKAGDQLRAIAQTPNIAQFFDGLFQSLGVVMDSGEELTVYHEGAQLRVVDGLDKSKVDFVLPLVGRDIGNMVGFADDGKIDEVEATHIAKVFFTPFTRETLKSPLLSNDKKRKKAGIEELIHVYLMLPDGSQFDSHTLIFAQSQWIVLDGIVGKAGRTYTLNAMEALKYQRKILEAMKTDTKKGWISFAKWYKQWRTGVSSTPRDIGE
jgi:hypothetical protein